MPIWCAEYVELQNTGMPQKQPQQWGSTDSAPHTERRFFQSSVISLTLVLTEKINSKAFTQKPHEAESNLQGGDTTARLLTACRLLFF